MTEQAAGTVVWTDDEHSWINAEMNSATKLGMAARIISRWGKDWHREGRDEATYNSALNDVMDLADTITRLQAELAAARQGGQWLPVEDGTYGEMRWEAEALAIGVKDFKGNTTYWGGLPEGYALMRRVESEGGL